MMLPADKWADIAEPSALEFGSECGYAMGLRLLQSIDIQYSDPTSVACGNKNLIAVANQKGDYFQISQRVTRQINLPTLSIA